MAGAELVIAATFTADPIEPFALYSGRQLDVDLTVRLAPYDQVFQQLLAPASLLNRCTGLRVVLVRPQDWLPKTASHGATIDLDEAGREAVLRNADEFSRSLRSAADTSATPFLVCICPVSPEWSADREGAALFRGIEEQLEADLKDLRQCHVVTSAELLRSYAVNDVHDPSSDELGHVPYTPEMFAALGARIVRTWHALNMPPYKVIVLDCDQTLWDGVSGEDGALGVRVDAPRDYLQRFMLERLEAGMLLCLCSKNSEPDVFDVLEQHPDMVLRREHLVSSRINWDPKSRNIRSLAEQLQLGIDSFIFVDDNPVECAEVQAGCPEVLTLQLPEDPEAIPQFLSHVWAFDRLGVTAEDKKRTILYQQDVERRSYQASAGTLSDFLQGLELQVKMTRPDPTQLTRAAQLTLRTNQFNCTTVRRSEAEIRALLDEGTLEGLVVEVSDRFGDYGLVGLMLYAPIEAWIEVDTFLLSCRVLGRGVEHRMLARLGELALERDLEFVDVAFKPTERNLPARNLLEQTGSEFKTPDGEVTRFRYPAAYASRVEVGQEATGDGSASAPPAPKRVRAASASSGRPAQDRGSRLRSIATRLNSGRAIVAQVAAERVPVSRRSRKAHVAPRTEMERVVVDIWREELFVDRIGVDDRFFDDLGGTSFQALRVFSAIERRRGKRLPLAVLLEHDTPAKLAEMIESESWSADWSPLVAIRAEGSQPPFFCVHGHLGNVVGFHELARHLGRDRPVYGLQSEGLDGSRVERRSFEEIARRYVEWVQTVQPQGPYLLGGFCMGGTLALEMARQLRSEGHEVGPLIMIEAGHVSYPRYRRGVTGVHRKVYAMIQRTDYEASNLRNLHGAARRAYLRAKLQRVAKRMRHRFEKGTELLLGSLGRRINHSAAYVIGELADQLDQAFKDYRPQPYDGDVVLFSATKQPHGIVPDPRLGWGEILTGRLETRWIPGHYFNIMVEPVVGTLGAEIENTLREGSSSPPLQSRRAEYVGAAPTDTAMGPTRL